MTLFRTFLAVLLLLATLGRPVAGAEAVDVELVLLADASGSIDDAEILFQRQGYATAITDPQVIAAISQGYEQRVAVTYVEWGAADSQEVVVPWTIIDGAESAAAFAEKLMAPPRLAFGRNAIGNALAAGQALIESNDITGFRKVIDFSGDSANNWGGIPITTARDAAVAAGIVINGLAILCRQCSGRPISYDLEEAFERLIIGGPGAFLMTVQDPADLPKALEKKFWRDLIAGNSLSVNNG